MTCKFSPPRAFTLLIFSLLAAFAARAQSLTEFYAFPSPGTMGNDPTMTLIQATDGNYYGTAAFGGAGTLSGCANNIDCGGTIFKITPSGAFTLLYTFCISVGCPDGQQPYGGLLQANDGNFYGTTYAGGAYTFGTVYRITPEGVMTMLHSFCSNNCSAHDGYGPKAALLQASNGALYGVTTANTIFRVTTRGQFTLVYTFPQGTGQNPGPQSPLIQASNGLLYGTTSGDGASGEGSVFKMTLAGVVTTLYSFCPVAGCADGSVPVGGLVQGADGNFYGTTSSGGLGYGTVFRITPGGKFTSLYSFNSGTDGANPVATMTLGSDGNIYGTTAYGGGNTTGVVFQLSHGALANEYPLMDGLCIGGHPNGGLLQATNGNFYGTDLGGCGDYGTVFEFSQGLGAFITTIPTFAKVGARVVIQGSDLTGATSVTFNGFAAKFKVLSATEITTVVPAGATTGKVQVSTPGGTLTSNLSFTVK